MQILVTGGAGFIGSHTCVELLNAGYEVVVIDNLSNSSEESLRRVEKITGKSLVFYKGDILDRPLLDRIFTENQIAAVIHFAGLKSVPESVHKPIEYYHNNLEGTLCLCDVMRAHNVKKMVFSSSATVYGNPDHVPVTEDMPLSTTNPYGSTKLIIERILTDIHNSDNDWSVALLRYFNPVGAHESGMIGENPNGIPANLMPYITQVAVGKLECLNVTGNDYDTPDGTGVRDYIHVVDLAKGHIKAVEKVLDSTGAQAYNLGTGIGYSVLDVVKAFEEASGKKINYRFAPRRPGDIASVYADPNKALKQLHWKAEKDILAMCRDAWRWQSQNPNGYDPAK